MTNSIINNNRLTKLSIGKLSKYNLIIGNKCTSNVIDGVLSFSGGSEKNTSSSNFIECTNTDTACRCILCQNEGTTDNNSINDTMVLPSTATRNLFFAELSPATGNNATNNITFKK